MRRQKKKVAPGNAVCDCECHSNPEIKHPSPCCFTCPKCKQQIVAHIYNAHVQSCDRAAQIMAERERKRAENQPEPEAAPELPPERPKKKKIKDLPVMPGSTRTRYRKR